MDIINEQCVHSIIQTVQGVGTLLTTPSALYSIQSKGKTDFVTNIDLTIQDFLHGYLLSLTPAVQFVGEEQDSSDLEPDQPYWVLDPVDGTTNLIHQFQYSAISLALIYNRQIQFGIVYDPYSKECFTAQLGAGAFCNERRIRVSQTKTLQESLISVGTVPGRRDLSDIAFMQMKKIYDQCHDVRRTGCASLDLCWVATGRLDGFIELHLHPWDYAAGALIVTEAGGKISDPCGNPISLLTGGGILASNGLIHAKIQSILELV